MDSAREGCCADFLTAQSGGGRPVDVIFSREVVDTRFVSGLSYEARAQFRRSETGIILNRRSFSAPMGAGEEAVVFAPP